MSWKPSNLVPWAPDSSVADSSQNVEDWWLHSAVNSFEFYLFNRSAVTLGRTPGFYKSPLSRLVQPQDKGSNEVVTRIVIWIPNSVIERLLGLLHAVVCVISSA